LLEIFSGLATREPAAQTRKGGGLYGKTADMETLY
jgi:hypothetical protein